MNIYIGALYCGINCWLIDFTDHMSCLTEYMEARHYDLSSDKRTVNDMLLIRN